MTDLPLDGVRIIDLATGRADQTTRLLADLGADVVRIEPPAGCRGRGQEPAIGGRSIAYAIDNANKRGAVLNPESPVDRQRFHDLVAESDILVDSGNPGRAATFGHTCAAWAQKFDHLVALSITDFGLEGPRARWRATDAVLVAMSTVLSRSGAPDGPPILPPDGIASATAAAQAAWAVLVSYFRRLRTGHGDYIDFSRYEAVLQALDPPFGAQGQAAAARGLSTARRGRPKHQDSYPIFACRDGWVRICILAPRQWRAMRAWLGEPADFQDPRYDSIAARAADFDQLRVLIAELFSDHAAAELVELGARKGIPIAAVLSPTEVFDTEHFRTVGSWTTADLHGVGVLTVPDGSVVLDGKRAGIRWLAPPVPDGRTVRWSTRTDSVVDPQPAQRPLEGVRILDLGVIVAGGELGRLFADMGAEVIKVESPSHPDGLRQARPGQRMSESFAWTHRNQQALGLDLRRAGGPAVFGHFVEHADAVFANFKPGTLASLGFGFPQLQEHNPGVILVESSAFGDTGPWSTRMGYGPLVRASTGISRLWSADTVGDTDDRYPFADAVTVFPDHLVARLAAVAALAALIRRRRTGRGAHVHISQAEAAISQLGPVYAASWSRAAGAEVSDDLSVHGVLPCAGDDEWCTLSIESDADWDTVVRVLGAADTGLGRQFDDGRLRWTNRAELWSTLGELTCTRPAAPLCEELQQAGVAAAPMLRAGDVLTDPQVVARGLYTEMAHPLFDVELPTEMGPAPFRDIPPAPLRPAPLLGQDTVDICRRLLGMSDHDIEHLITEAVLYAADTEATTMGANRT